MFAMSAMSVQNVNAQDTVKEADQKITTEKEAPQQPQEANQSIAPINKEKPQQPLQPKEEQATTKGNATPKKLSNKTATDPNIGKNKPQEETELKALQKDPKQQNDVQVEEKDKGKPMDYTNKNSSTNKHKYNTGEKVQNETQTGTTDKNNDGGKETIKKGSERVPNGAKVEKKNVNLKKTAGKETIKKGSERVPNNANVEKKDANQSNASGGTLKRKNVPSKPNSVVKPKDKPQEDANTSNNNASDK